MSENNYGVSLNIEKHRVSMESYGNLFGKQIFTVITKNMDPLYNEKRRLNQPCLMVPLKIYDLKKIDVRSLVADVDAGNNPVVIINGDPDLRFPITKPDLREVTVATVREAVESFENKGNPVFFADCAKITAEVIALNNGEQVKANTIAKEAAIAANAYRDLIQIQKDAQCRYYEQINLQTTTDLNLNVEIL